ncbi:MAG: ATP-binding cassette domain-containing protein [Erysipelotrichales bacterium]
MLVANKINKSYGDNLVLKDFDITINKNEIIALVGKSGTGKTTLMRALNNLEHIDNGTISIDGIVLCESISNKAHYSKRDVRRRYQNKIGMVFQDFALFPNLSVMENLIEAPLAQKIADRKTLIEQATKLLKDVDLLEKKDARPNTLSGGQKQRIAIARALMLKPEILCFDEPTSALDNESAKSIVGLINKIANDGTGVLIITHNLKFAKEVATKIINSDEFVV